MFKMTWSGSAVLAQRLKRFLEEWYVPSLSGRNVSKNDFPICDRALLVARRRIATREPERRPELVIRVEDLVQLEHRHRARRSPRREETGAVLIDSARVRARKTNGVIHRRVGIGVATHGVEHRCFIFHVRKSSNPPAAAPNRP